MGTPSMADESKNRAVNLWLAKLAEQAERYDDMVSYMKAIIKIGVKGDELETEERNLISVGYKNLMSTRRTAWRTVEQTLQKETKAGNAEMIALITAYKQTISDEIKGIIDGDERYREDLHRGSSTGSRP